MTHTTLTAIAWTLIHFCWQAAAIAAVYRLLSLAFAKRTSHARYLLALSALLLMLATSVTTFAWEMRSAPSIPTAATANTAVSRTLAELKIAPIVTPPTGSTQLTDSSPSLVSLVPRLVPLIDAFWLIGIIVLSIRSLGGWWLIQRLRATATIEPSAAMQAAFQRIATALGLRRLVLLRITNAIAGPVTVGALRSLVLLPLSAATSLGPDELEVVLAHELAHVRRADFFWNLLQTLAETLFFFHPAVWWIGARIRHERELCCDDLALQVCPNPIVYAHALFHLEEQRSQNLQLAMALDGHQSPQTLRIRIARILGEPMPRSAQRPMRPFSLAAACAALIVLLLPVPQVLAGLAPSHAAIASAPIDSSTPHPASWAVNPEPATLSPRIATPQPKPVIVAAAQDPAPQEKPSESSDPKSNYIDRMKAAGYDVDLDKYIAMKIQGITPEYAASMSQMGFGKLTADELIACKVQNVTPQFLTSLKDRGLEAKTLQDAISFRIFDVSPEFVAGMKAAGFDSLSPQKLLELRIQGITPEYATSIRKQFPDATTEDVVKTRIFNIDAAFIAEAKAHGFTGLSLDKLVQLRISGVLDDESVKK
ncbi:MAG: M56 family metallopeptidase [Terracidiphilus sp.]|jgi:beta-lactamase regulating signal transducer with metallopeptidase domain